MPNITFENVKKVYPNGTYALDGVSFTINEGDFVCLVGASGGGKTTLLKLISGLDIATCGEIYLDGEISNYLKVVKRNVAFVFQEYTIYPNMTVFENIVFALKKEKYSYDEKCLLANEIIKKMKMELISGELPKHLSFGQCQKVALAKALVRKPEIILFDEPLSNIDASAKNEYKNLILSAKKILPNSTFIYVTHKIDDAMKLANKIMVLDKGKILQYDQKQIVFEYPNCQTVADYMIEEKQVYLGKIEDNIFKSIDKQLALTDFQVATLNGLNMSNVTCYHTTNINYYFDSNHNSITGMKKNYIIDAYYIDNILSILGKSIDISKLEKALISQDIKKIVFSKENFSFKEIEDAIDFNGVVNYANNDYITVKIKDLILPFENVNHLKENDNITLYYPLFKLKALDSNNNFIISSYEISENILTCKVLNQKKGIIKVGKTKVFSEQFKKYSKEVIIQVELDAFDFNLKGKFTCDVLFNEERLSRKCLLHFETKGVSEYLSALVKSSFKGFKKKIIKYDIDFTKIKIIDGN